MCLPSGAPSVVAGGRKVNSINGVNQAKGRHASCEPRALSPNGH